MKKFLSTLLLLAAVTLCQAEIYTIQFNSSESGNDGTGATTDVAKLIRMSTFEFVTGIDADKTNNVYVGKNGYGMKGGTGSVGGKVAFVLDTTYTVRTMTLYAAAQNKADTAATKGISVCGQEIHWQSPRMELQPYVVTLNRPLDTITIAALAEKNCRFYVEHIDLDIEDTYPNRGKLQMPAASFAFPSMEYDDQAPAEDEESFEVLAGGMTAAGISLRMKTGTTFHVSPATLPATGGEFTINYSTNVKPSYYDIVDTCIISGTGLNGTVVTKRMAVSTMVYEPRPYIVDSSQMTISIAPTAEYYQPIENLTDSALKSTLGQIIIRGNRYKYGSGNHKSWDGFYYTDRDTTDNSVLDMYSNQVRYFNPAKPTASVAGFDIEHMFPKSWWGRTVNKAYCDLFHLVPGDNSANRSKSNHAPGVPTDTTFWNGSFATGNNEHGKVFCPADEYKGDFARAYFYIACCYGDSLTWIQTEGSEPAAAMTNDSWEEFRPWLRDLLLEWHRLDPVSEKETTRAIEVNKIQGNRNPFIDYPDLVEYIWGNARGRQLHLADLDCSFDQPTSLREATSDKSDKAATLRVVHGQIIIRRNNIDYTIQGTTIR